MSGGTRPRLSWSGSHIDYWSGNLWTDATVANSILMRAADPVDLSSTGWYSPDQNSKQQATQNLVGTNPSNSGPHQVVIADVLGKIKTGLEGSAYPTCKAWLVNAPPILQAILTNNTMGHVTLTTDTVAAFVGHQNPDRSEIGVPVAFDYAITVNDRGAFFNATDSLGRAYIVGRRSYPGNSLRAQLETLVHETAHLVHAAGFQSDFGIPIAGKSNDTLVDANCKALIEGFNDASISSRCADSRSVVASHI